MTHGETYVYRRDNIDFTKDIDHIAREVSNLPKRMQRNVAMMYYNEKLSKHWSKSDPLRKIQSRFNQAGSVAHSERSGIYETVQIGASRDDRASNNTTETRRTKNLSEFGKSHKSGEGHQRDTPKNKAQTEREKRTSSETAQIGGGAKRREAETGAEVLLCESGCHKRETSRETQGAPRVVQSTCGEAETHGYVYNDGRAGERASEDSATNQSGEVESEEQRERAGTQQSLQADGRLQTAGSGESERETSEYEERSAFTTAEDYYDYHELKRIFEKYEIQH